MVQSSSVDVTIRTADGVTYQFGVEGTLDHPLRVNLFFDREVIEFDSTAGRFEPSRLTLVDLELHGVVVGKIVREDEVMDRYPCGNTVMGYPAGSAATCRICQQAHVNLGGLATCTNLCEHCGHCHVAHDKA